jgi:hypothetical protein
MSDLAPDIASLLAEHWRTTPVWQKLTEMHELNETLKMLALSDLRRRYPRASEAQLQRRLAERWLGTELALRVYGPLSEDEHATG